MQLHWQILFQAASESNKEKDVEINNLKQQDVTWIKMSKIVRDFFFVSSLHHGWISNFTSEESQISQWSSLLNSATNVNIVCLSS